MKTNEELFEAAAKTLDLAANFFGTDHDSAEHARQLAADLRALAAAARAAPAPASMTEPVAWIHHISDNDDREHTIVDFERTHPMSVHKGDVPLYAHPAPAPAEHTAADAPQHGVQKDRAISASDAAVGVPDVAELIDSLRKFGHFNENYVFLDAADALAALQAQIYERDNWLSPETVREHYLPLPELVGYENTIAQQAERITALKAKLADAVGMLEEMLRHSEVGLSKFDLSPESATGKRHANVRAFLHKASEVMG